MGRRSDHLGTLEERFWQKVDKNGPILDLFLGQCWIWTGARQKDGHGRIRVGEKLVGAHVVSWELHNGKVPEGMHVRHKCDNAPCVRDSHLELGSVSQNIKDQYKRGRRVRRG